MRIAEILSQIIPFKLGISKGNMKSRILDLLAVLGMRIDSAVRQFTIPINSQTISEITLINSAEVLASLEDRIIDVGITGDDRLADHQARKRGEGAESHVYILGRLSIGKKKNKPVDVVMFCQADRDIDDIKLQDFIIIHSEYPYYAKEALRELFPDHTLEIKTFKPEDRYLKEFSEKKVLIIPIGGGTEQKTASGEGDFGICVSESGKSIRDNDLKVVEVLMQSSLVIVSRKAKPEYECFAKNMRGALNLKQKCILKFNLSSDKEELLLEIVDFLPSAKSPTIGTLFDGGIVVETEIPDSQYNDVTTKLQMCGVEACGIVKLTADAAV